MSKRTETDHDNRQRILSVLDEISREKPIMRFGQLVANMAILAQGPVKSAVWDVEDNAFLKASTEYLRALKMQSHSVEIGTEEYLRAIKTRSHNVETDTDV